MFVVLFVNSKGGFGKLIFVLILVIELVEKIDVILIDVDLRKFIIDWVNVEFGLKNFKVYWFGGEMII